MTRGLLPCANTLAGAGKQLRRKTPLFFFPVKKSSRREATLRATRHATRCQATLSAGRIACSPFDARGTQSDTRGHRFVTLELAPCGVNHNQLRGWLVGIRTRSGFNFVHVVHRFVAQTAHVAWRFFLLLVFRVTSRPSVHPTHGKLALPSPSPRSDRRTFPNTLHAPHARARRERRFKVRLVSRSPARVFRPFCTGYHRLHCLGFTIATLSRTRRGRFPPRLRALAGRRRVRRALLSKGYYSTSVP